jgi:hypothetical protein
VGASLIKSFGPPDKDGHEVDLVLARNAFEPLLDIEIKSYSALVAQLSSMLGG